ncbi:hypothetical protein BGZ96_012364 [Linnemannia gamsii]|uniref:F-box domain-containing protein n=1 Tax=Linnemannia gamsii TaxID=64522 RepID=A0ABQ7JQI8_9FUNG|nr:hypothetical protein BGZ96_012364 [Linnemannia gamsii]
MGISNWELSSNVHLIFAHCPNVKKLAMSAVTGNEDALIVARLIGTACPKISSLQYGSTYSDALDSLPFRIMDSLPAQQVANLTYNGTLVSFTDYTNNNSLRRHSASMRSIVITGQLLVAMISASAILKECHALETCRISFEWRTGHYTTLADAVEFSWSCTKLTRLTLAISGCELPVEPGVKPYYNRPSPITLTNAESQHLTQLEALYRQIGMLTRLTFLKLIMVKLGGQGQVDVNLMDAPASFPALLNLENAWIGRPGYLHHLSGLRKLKRLEGSFRADTEETRATMDYPELIWMDQNWPVLEYADFFRRLDHVRKPFKWLRDKRVKDGRDKLELGCVNIRDDF